MSDDIEQTSFKMDLEVSVEIDTKDIATRFTNEQVRRFIIEVDDEMEDWDFTLELYEHFAALKAVHDVEFPPDAAVTASE